MSPLPVTIHSDQEAATALLGEIAARCAAHGAEWHPELRAEVAEGAMRLWAPPGTTGPLITMPTPLLVPIEAARWGDGATALELLTPPETASPVQRQLLELHAALYNATDKLRWWSTQHPARLVERCPAVAEALLPLKPGHGEGPLKPTAAERFLATRSFGWRAEPVDDPKQTVLMPLIDLLNHHHRGAPLYALCPLRAVADQRGGGGPDPGGTSGGSPPRPSLRRTARGTGGGGRAAQPPLFATGGIPSG